MQIMIDIPEEIYNSACATNNIWDMRMAGFVCSAIANGISIPKGHGRLIDADALTIKLKAWDINANGIPNYAWKCIREMPTIIEADNGESEDKDEHFIPIQSLTCDDIPTILEADKGEADGK